MKQLIKQILKEETEDDRVRVSKGINALVSLVKNTFPFIVGWVWTKEDWNGQVYGLYINLVIDQKKVKEIYGLNYRSWYEGKHSVLQKVIDDKSTYAYPISILDYESEGIDPYEDNRAIKDLVNDTYEIIPDEYKVIINRPTYSVPKTLVIDSYIFV